MAIVLSCDSADFFGSVGKRVRSQALLAPGSADTICSSLGRSTRLGDTPLIPFVGFALLVAADARAAVGSLG